MDEQDEIKMTMLVILSGRADGERLMNYLCFLADKCGISDESDYLEPKALSATTIFASNSISYLNKEDYDGWVEYFKNCMLKEENYEMIDFLLL